MKLDLGCSDRPQPGHLGVDICPPCDQIVDLSQYPWPWPDSSVDAVYAWDVFEHLPSKRSTMNELWRILIPGGQADVCVPTTRGAGADCDPTHITRWTAGDFEYYEAGNFARERFRNSPYYGVKGDFKIVEWKYDNYPNRFGEDVWKFRVVLEAVK